MVRVHLNEMDMQPRRIVSLVLVLCSLPAAVFADPPAAVNEAERASQEQMQEQLRKARELDRQREAARAERVRESQAAKTVRTTSGPPQEPVEEKRARARREAEARREVRAADRLRDRDREGLRQKRR